MDPCALHPMRWRRPAHAGAQGFAQCLLLADLEDRAFHLRRRMDRFCRSSSLSHVLQVRHVVWATVGTNILETHHGHDPKTRANGTTRGHSQEHEPPPKQKCLLYCGSRGLDCPGCRDRVQSDGPQGQDGSAWRRLEYSVHPGWAANRWTRRRRHRTACCTAKRRYPYVAGARHHGSARRRGACARAGIARLQLMRKWAGATRIATLAGWRMPRRVWRSVRQHVRGFRHLPPGGDIFRHQMAQLRGRQVGRLYPEFQHPVCNALVCQ